MSLWWSLPALVGVPLVGMALLLLLGEPRRWMPWAAGVAIASTLQSVGFALVDGSGVGWALAVNGALATSVVLSQPRRGLVRRDLAMPLAWLGAGALVLVAQDVRLVVAGWILPPALVFVRLRSASEREAKARRVVGAYLLGGSVPLVVAAWLFADGAARAGVATPWDVGTWRAEQLSPQVAGLVFLLVSVAAMVRLGVPPLHSWLPTLTEALPPGSLVPLTGVQLVVHVMVRLALAPLPHAVPDEAALVMSLGVVGTLYAAVMAAAQHRMRRVVAFVVVAQSSALLVGIASHDAVSVSGALTSAISVALTGRGLMLVAAAIEARVGTVDLRQMTGIAHPAPRLGAAMILLAFGAVGLPGSLGFVGEDLLLHGLLEHEPLVAGVLVVSTAVVGIALLRAALRTAFGPPPAWASSVPDLLPRERPLLLLGVAAVLLGIFPQTLVDAHRNDAKALLSAEADGAPGSAAPRHDPAASVDPSSEPAQSTSVAAALGSP